MDVGTISNNTSAVMSSKVNKETKQTTEVKKCRVYGNIVGQPKLSEQGMEYYEKLKEKYKGMEFVLVSKDKKDMARAHADRFANPAQMVVLIDEEKIEQMAADPEYRKYYESLIAKAQKNLPKLSKIVKAFPNVKGFGMDMTEKGTVSFFVVMHKTSDSQTKRIEDKKEEKRLQQKKAQKKAEKEAVEERLEKNRRENKEAIEEHLEKINVERKEATKIQEDKEVVLRADSLEELQRLMEEYNFANRANFVQSEAEKYLGTVIDFKG